MKDVECFKCHKKGHSANKCPDAMSKDGKGFFKVRQLEEPSPDKKEEKSIRQIRSDIRILIRVTKTLFFAIGSTSTIWLGRFAMRSILVT